MTRIGDIEPTLIICTFIISVLILITSSIGGNNQLKYSSVRILIDYKEDINDLQRAGIEIERVHTFDNYIDVVLDEKQIEILKTTGKQFEILIKDFNKHYDDNVSLTKQELKNLNKKMNSQYTIKGFELGSMGGFYTFAEVVTELDSMYLNYPNLITEKESIGKSIEDRDIWMVKISDNPNIDEDEPEVFYNALHHPREPGSLVAVMYFMYYILENYGIDPFVTFLVDNRELYFVPAINPDGYVYNEETHPNGGGMWRKNKRDNNGSGVFEENNDGVNLNRNYGFQWGYDNNGSSPNPSREGYRGAAPFSEPETQAIRDLCESRHFQLAVNYHAGYGSCYFSPWSYIWPELPPDSTIFIDLLQDMSQYNHYIWLNTDLEMIGADNGVCLDWMYGEQISKEKIFGITCEVIKEYWPSPEKIYDIAEENVYPNLVLALGQGVIETDLTIQNANISATNLTPGIDTLFFTTKISNPNFFPITVATIFEGFDSTLVDTIPMFDDGSHFDSLANDGNYGGFWLAEENKMCYAHINVKSDLHGYSFGRICREFTTVGPVVFEDYSFVNPDSIVNPSEMFVLKFTLKNEGLITTASNISVRLSSLDSFATVATNRDISFGDIAPRESKNASNPIFGVFAINLADNCPPNRDIPFKVDILSYNHPFWSDTFYVHIYPTGVTEAAKNIPDKFALSQNNPNHFNPTTTISYQLPVISQVELTIYSITGQKIATLVSEQQQAGNHRFEWDAGELASGVYFYRLVAKNPNGAKQNFVETKKLILLK